MIQFSDNAHYHQSSSQMRDRSYRLFWLYVTTGHKKFYYAKEIYDSE